MLGVLPSLNEATLCTFFGLKGLYNSALGKVLGGTIRNVALGMGCMRKTVRKDSMNNANIPFRTELQDIISGKHKVIALVRYKIFSSINVIARTILMLILQPMATLCLPFD